MSFQTHKGHEFETLYAECMVCGSMPVSFRNIFFMNDNKNLSDTLGCKLAVCHVVFNYSVVALPLISLEFGGSLHFLAQRYTPDQLT